MDQDGRILEVYSVKPRGLPWPEIVLPGALALPDIGTLFADDDPRWEGADSATFLHEARRLMAERGAKLMRSILNERRRDTVVMVDEELLQRFAPSRS